MNMSLRGLVSCLVISLFFAYELMQLHMLNAIAAPLMQDLSLSVTDFSTLCSAYLFADVLFLIPAGMLLDRLRIRTVVMGALCLCILGTFGLAYSHTLIEASLAHFLSGIGNAFCFLSCMVLAAGWFEKKSSFVMSLMITIGLLGGVVAQLPFTLLVEQVGWKLTLVIDGIVGGMVFIFNALFLREHPHTPRTVHGISWRQLKRSAQNPIVWTCGLYTGFLNLPLMIISAMVGNLYLQSSFGFSAQDAAFVSSMISLGTIIGSPSYGLISKIYTKRIWMIFGSILSLIIFALIWTLQAPSVMLMATLFFALGLFSASQVLGYPMITDSSPQELRGTSMGLSALVIMGLAFLAQPLTGFLIDLAKSHHRDLFSYAFLLFPLGFLISLVMAFFARERAEFSVSAHVS